MALVVTNAGELLLLKWAFKATTTPENLELRLYTNDYTPIATSVSSDFTEATFTNYAAKLLSRGNWQDPSTSDGKAVITYSVAEIWVAGSSETIQGYYITGETSGTVLYAEKFTSSVALTSGVGISIQPTITGASEN